MLRWVFDKLMKVVGQSRHVLVQELVEVFCAMPGVVGLPGHNSRDNKHGVDVVPISNFQDHWVIFL